MNLVNEVKITRVSNAAAAGTTAISSDSVDMTNFDSVMFVAMFGAITASAVTSINGAQSSDDSTFADLEGTKVSIADDEDNKMLVLDIERPSDRYVRCEVARATANAVLDSIIAIQYNGRTKPVVQGSTVADSEHHVSPAEGTA